MPYKKAVVEEVKNLAVYVVLLIVFLVLVDMKTGNLKDEINTVVREECKAGSSTAALHKYNDSIQLQIAVQRTNQRLHTARGKPLLASINALHIARLQRDLIPIPKQDCSVPLIK